MMVGLYIEHGDMRRNTGPIYVRGQWDSRQETNPHCKLFVRPGKAFITWGI
jgi:hypothetical protein